MPDHLPHDFDKKLVLTRLHAGSPAVSLQDDDTFYIMTKVDFSDHKSWVLAVNTSTKALQGLAEFGAERCVGFNYTYTQSGISKHTGIESNALPHKHPQALWNLFPILGKKGGPPVPNAIAQGVALELNLFEALT
ncbi:uncharacterized protein LOC125510134 [Triticum urartu]|uniref:uncharacterized protein LOC125510134 n=1 Tax=Triticum urartu TaxID=4572 RepID=UPI00204413BF|nr:uncharacterized protein LOC125510134 [Triticum urartu]